MKWLGFSFLVYASVCLDLSGHLQRISPFVPLALDLVFLGLILGGQGSGAVCGAAVTGLLTAVVMGTNPALGLIAAATCSALIVAIRSSTSRPSAGRMFSVAACIGGCSLVRGLDSFAQAPSKSLLEHSLWMFVAPSGVMVALACAWLVAEDCVSLRSRQGIC